MNATSAAMDRLLRRLRVTAWKNAFRLGVLVPALLFLQGNNAAAQVVYFLVGDVPGKPPTYESYVLPLSGADDIAHARDLIARGPGVGQPLVVAWIGPNDSGINRNFQDPRLHAWSWEVKESISFADCTTGQLLLPGEGAGREWWHLESGSTK